MGVGKKKRFMELYEPVHARFEKFCKARVYGDFDFKDLMHDTLLIAFERLDQLKNDGAFLHFLFGISIKVLSNAHRKIKNERFSDHAKVYDFHIESDRSDRQLEIDALYEALGKLPEVQRETVILFEITGFSIKEIAELQESSMDAVKQRLVRGRKQLVKLLTEKEVESNELSYDRR